MAAVTRFLVKCSLAQQAAGFDKTSNPAQAVRNWGQLASHLAATNPRAAMALGGAGALGAGAGLGAGADALFGDEDGVGRGALAGAAGAAGLLAGGAGARRLAAGLGDGRGLSQFLTGARGPNLEALAARGPRSQQAVDLASRAMGRGEDARVAMNSLLSANPRRVMGVGAGVGGLAGAGAGYGLGGLGE